MLPNDCITEALSVSLPALGISHMYCMPNLCTTYMHESP